MSENVYKPKYTPTEIMTMMETAVSKQMYAKPSWAKDDTTDWVLTRTVESQFQDYGVSDAVVHVGARKEKEEPVVEDDGFELE